MDEHVLRTVLRLDKPVALLRVKPLHSTDTHRASLTRKFWSDALAGSDHISIWGSAVRLLASLPAGPCPYRNTITLKWAPRRGSTTILRRRVTNLRRSGKSPRPITGARSQLSRQPRL